MDLYVLTVLALDAGVTAAWFLLFLATDPRRQEKGTPRTLFRFLVLGGAGSTLVTLVLSEIAYGTVGGFLLGGPALIDGFFHEFFFVGPVEELAKFGLFLALASRGGAPTQAGRARARRVNSGRMQRAPKRAVSPAFLEPRDALLQAASVALGFAAIENFFYAFVYGPSVLWSRSLLAVSGHLAYSSLWGAASANLVFAPPAVPREERWKVVLAALFLSGMVHGLYNYFLDMGAFWAGVGLDAMAFAGATIVFRHFARLDPFRPYRFSESERAVEAIRLALRVQPGHFKLNRRIALYYVHLAQYPPGAGHLERCIRQQPRDRYLRFYRAVALALSEDGRRRPRHSREELAQSLERFRLSELPALRGFVARLVGEPVDRRTVLMAIDEREAPRTGQRHQLRKRRWLAAPPRSSRTPDFAQSRAAAEASGS